MLPAAVPKVEIQVSFLSLIFWARRRKKDRPPQPTNKYITNNYEQRKTSTNLWPKTHDETTTNSELKIQKTEKAPNGKAKHVSVP